FRSGRGRGWLEGAEVELHGAGALRQPESRDDARMKLAGVADDSVVQPELGASPGMPWRLVTAANGQFGSGGPGQDAGRLDRVGPVGRASGPPPARTIARSGQHDGSVPGLIRQGRFEPR